MEETSGRVTEEGFLFQDGQTCDRCCVNRKEQQFTVYKLHQQKISPDNSITKEKNNVHKHKRSPSFRAVPVITSCGNHF